MAISLEEMYIDQKVRKVKKRNSLYLTCFPCFNPSIHTICILWITKQTKCNLSTIYPISQHPFSPRKSVNLWTYNKKSADPPGLRVRAQSSFRSYKFDGALPFPQMTIGSGTPQGPTFHNFYEFWAMRPQSDIKQVMLRIPQPNIVVK